MNFKQLEDLAFDEYKVLLRDAYIDRLQQTQKGQEYLENAWILEQTKPDREELRKHFK